MKENRVKVSYYGRIESEDDPRLIEIPSVKNKKCFLHVLAASAFVIMAAACYKDTKIKLKAVSGWRKHKWQSREQYNEYLIKNYGTISKGMQWVAFDSPHETGLAVDIQAGGLEAVSATVEKQKETEIYKWLSKNAAKFGFTPYLKEPWHWEFNISKEEWDKNND